MVWWGWFLQNWSARVRRDLLKGFSSCSPAQAVLPTGHMVCYSWSAELGLMQLPVRYFLEITLVTYFQFWNCSFILWSDPSKLQSQSSTVQLVGITNLFLIVLIIEDKWTMVLLVQRNALEGRRGIESESSLHPQRPSLSDGASS
jgi:hypothetical protein